MIEGSGLEGKETLQSLIQVIFVVENPESQGVY